MDARSENEFREFVTARSLALLRTAYVLTGDQHHAEDAVQNALAKLAARWRKVDDPEAYVRRILYHDQVTWWRRRRKFREDPTVLDPDQMVHGSVQDPAGHVDRRIDLSRALRRLGPRQRAVLVLRFLEDLPEREVAQILGCSVGTVRSQTARALARLRSLTPELAERPLGTVAHGQQLASTEVHT